MNGTRSTELTLRPHWSPLVLDRVVVITIEYLMMMGIGAVTILGLSGTAFAAVAGPSLGVALYLVARAARTSVLIRTRGITFRNFWWTHSLTWDQLEAFIWKEASQLPLSTTSYSMLYAERADEGRRIPVVATAIPAYVGQLLARPERRFFRGLPNKSFVRKQEAMIEALRNAAREHRVQWRAESVSRS